MGRKNEHGPLRIGVLAVQGAFAEHRAMLHRLGAESFEIRAQVDLGSQMDGLILPGGESTVQTKLLHELGLFTELDRQIREGLPVYGTCAGLILLAKQIENDHMENFASMDITAVRNAYGHQLGSFLAHAEFAGQTIPMPFIRAPYIHAAGPEVEILSVVNGRIVAAKQGTMLVTAFHPEMAEDSTVHQYFLGMVTKVLSAAPPRFSQTNRPARHQRPISPHTAVPSPTGTPPEHKRPAH